MQTEEKTKVSSVQTKINPLAMGEEMSSQQKDMSKTALTGKTC